MVVATKAIVFSALKYSEADLIVTCFTQEAGIKSYMLRGVFKSKKGAVRVSYFQPLMQLDIVANHKNKGTLEYIKDVKVTQAYKTLHTNIVKMGVVMFTAEMLKSCIKEEEKNESLYNFIEESINWLDEAEEISNFHISFLLQLTKYLGFYPDTSDKEAQFFNLLEGYFENFETSRYSISGISTEALKQFLDKNLQQTAAIKLSKSERAGTLDLLIKYYQLHIQNFQIPKSLAVLGQLYK